MPERMPQLSSFDLKVLVRELEEVLKGCYLRKVYQVPPKLLLLKFGRPGGSARFLLLEAGRRLHLTRYVVEKPPEPPAFCRALRKHLSNSCLTAVRQPNLERIVVLEFSSGRGDYKLVAELFARGNILLLDGEGKILHVLSPGRMGGRVLSRGETYMVPPAGATNLPKNVGELLEALGRFKGEVVKALTRIYGVGGTYAEEFLLRAGVEKSKPAGKISREEAERIYHAAQTVFQGLENPKPCLYLENGKPVSVSPLPLEKFRNLKVEYFKTLNEAVDEFYSLLQVEEARREKSEKVRLKMEELKRIASEQEAKLESLKGEMERLRRIGEAIFNRAFLLQNLQAAVKSLVEREGWKGVEAEISKAKGQTILSMVKALNPKEKKVKVEVEGLEFDLSLDSSVYQQASSHLDEFKKLKAKLLSLENALKETLRKLASAEALAEMAEEKPVERGKIEEKEWYEKFRYFYTSEGLLVVAGRDAHSNEALVKRYARPVDLVFHSEVPGSPFAILRVEGGKEVSEASIRQAAQFTACYSRAWREEWSAVDVYYVKPEQLSKRAPSGTYLPRGSFMVYGKKNYLRGVPLRLALTVKLNGKLEISAMPPEAAEAHASYAVEIGPGRLKASSLAPKIKQKMVELAPVELKPLLLKVPEEEIASLIPYGYGVVLRAFKGKAKPA